MKTRLFIVSVVIIDPTFLILDPYGNKRSPNSISLSLLHNSASIAAETQKASNFNIVVAWAEIKMYTLPKCEN